MMTTARNHNRSHGITVDDYRFVPGNPAELTSGQVESLCERAGLGVALTAVVLGAIVEHRRPEDLPPELLREAALALRRVHAVLAGALRRIARAAAKMPG